MWTGGVAELAFVTEDPSSRFAMNTSDRLS
jgi:hypothetical protein